MVLPGSWGGVLASILRAIGADWQVVLGWLSARIADVMWDEVFFPVWFFLDVVSSRVLSKPGSLVLSEIYELNTIL